MIPKYRAWDKVNGTMHKVAGINFGINGGRVISLAETNRYNNNHKRWHTDIELLQSTGLKDINGTEIFEGDILKGVGVIGIAKFGRYLDYEYICYGLDGWLFSEKLKLGFIDLPLAEYVLDTDCSMEVVGNKFEHPHLLEED